MNNVNLNKIGYKCLWIGVFSFLPFYLIGFLFESSIAYKFFNGSLISLIIYLAILLFLLILMEFNIL